jgi:hypothetical protein
VEVVRRRCEGEGEGEGLGVSCGDCPPQLGWSLRSWGRCLSLLCQRREEGDADLVVLGESAPRLVLPVNLVVRPSRVMVTVHVGSSCRGHSQPCAKPSSDLVALPSREESAVLSHFPTTF